jgi:hypothetical protein
VGLTQLDFGLGKSWVWSFVGLERVVVDRGLSCSYKYGFSWVGSVKFGEAFGKSEKLHKMVNLMVGELKISCLSSLLGESKVSYGTSELEFDSIAITLVFLFFNE